MQEIYLDNAATTKPLDSVRDVLSEYLKDGWHNPSALYAPAVLDSKKMENARKIIQKSVAGGVFEVLFTSSGTEGDAAVILEGVKKQKRMHYITSIVEHPAVFQTIMKLEDAGREVTYVRPDSSGKVDPDAVAREVRDDTVLVSIMHVNNQTGAVSDIAEIARKVKAKNKNTLFHSDGVQAYMREDIGDAAHIDYYTVSAHKIHGLKGVGAVLYKKGSPLKALIPGGGQEKGLRSGTENTLGITAFSHAAEFFSEHKDENKNRLGELRSVFLNGISSLEDVKMISPQFGAPHILCLSVGGVRGEVLLHALEEKKIYISTGSACSSKKGIGRIGMGLGLTRGEAEGVVRVSFSPFNTKEETAAAAKSLIEAAQALRCFKRR